MNKLLLAVLLVLVFVAAGIRADEEVTVLEMPSTEAESVADEMDLGEDEEEVEAYVQEAETLAYTATVNTTHAADMLREINAVRANPKSLVAELTRRRDALKWNTQYSKWMYCAPGAVCLLLNEGKPAFEDAIRALNAQAPVATFTQSTTLNKAAQHMANLQGPTTQTGHTAPDGSTFPVRITRFGSVTGYSGENLAYGPNSARECLIQLIVDDGVASRGHRVNIFRPSFRRIGSGFAKHGTYRFMCVQEFADAANA